MVERKPDGGYRPVVMDFGLARDANESAGMTESGAVMGTAAFMSPEQARGDVRRLDRRTDVYSLGAMLYDLLTGRPPFVADSMADTLIKVMTEEAPSLRSHLTSAPDALDTIVSKCLNKEAEERYATAKELADDLGRFLENKRIVGKKVSLLYRLRWRAQRNRPLVAVASALMASLLLLAVYGVRTRIQTLKKERMSRQQAELAQRLGQEIKDMEWLLRSARQLPLHDLSREKGIIRRRMAQLQAELQSYGELSRGLAYYALGRGHLALHEYPQALAQLEHAIEQGNQSADVHYALGLVLGKHFEQAMYEARLSGGGDWAQKQLKQIEPKYLHPAIASLKRSRGMRLDAPRYLEGLISYYQRDYQAALKHAEAALQDAPWLYEALKLSGDIHLEQALQARDNGRYEDSEREFVAAVRSYTEAADSGRSDGEVYEGLAETWVRQIETSLNQGKPTDVAYAAAVEASSKISRAEPTSIAGPLKRGYAALMTMVLIGAGMSSEARVEQCLSSAEAVLKLQPGHPYASDLAAGCYAFSADAAIAKGQDPGPLYRKALNLLEPAVQQSPYFLWGTNDLATIYVTYGAYLQLHGYPNSRSYLEKSVEYGKKAVALDGTFLNAAANLLIPYSKLMPFLNSEAEIQSVLKSADAHFASCVKTNDKFQLCYINYQILHSKAAQRTQLAGGDPQPRLTSAREALAKARKLGGSFLDLEQQTALMHLVEATASVGRKQSPELALSELDADLTRCFGIAAQDAMCRTLAVQAEWLRADWLLQQGSSPARALNVALAKAKLATESPETYPDAWQALAATHVRLAGAPGVSTAARESHLAAGQAALDKLTSLNPNHAAGRVTAGALQLLRSSAEREPGARRAAAQSAIRALDQAVKLDALLKQETALLLAQARSLAAAP